MFDIFWSCTIVSYFVQLLLCVSVCCVKLSCCNRVISLTESLKFSLSYLQFSAFLIFLLCLLNSINKTWLSFNQNTAQMFIFIVCRVVEVRCTMMDEAFTD